jgi:hypothetical protein
MVTFKALALKTSKTDEVYGSTQDSPTSLNLSRTPLRN